MCWVSNLRVWILDKLDISFWESCASNQNSLNLSKVPGSYGRQQWERHRSCCWCFLLSIDGFNTLHQPTHWILTQPAQPAYSIESYWVAVHQLKIKLCTTNTLIFVPAGSPLLLALQPGQESLAWIGWSYSTSTCRNCSKKRKETEASY